MANNMNPIVKNETYKRAFLDSASVVPEETAVVLYPNKDRERCKVYLHGDIIYPREVRKYHFDRMAHISMNTFGFRKTLRFTFSEDISQWAEITYQFSVAIKPDEASVRAVFLNNTTDLSVQVSDLLGEHGAIGLSGDYSCTQSLLLETAAINRIKDIISRISFIKASVSQESVVRDRISERIIADYEATKIAKVKNIKLEEDLEREREEAEIRRTEAEIARINAEKDGELARINAEKDGELAAIQHKRKLTEHQYEVDIQTMGVAAEKALKLQKTENAAAVAAANQELRGRFDLDDLVVADSSFERYVELEQERIDRDRDNTERDLELARQKIAIIKEMVDTGVIDNMTAGNMTQQMLSGGMKNFELVRQKIKLIKEMSDTGIIDDMTARNMKRQLLIDGVAVAVTQPQIEAPKNIYGNEGDSVVNADLREDDNVDVK